MKANVDFMTYVDMSSRSFSSSLACPCRLPSAAAQAQSIHSCTVEHVALRTASLMVLGLILANADDAMHRA